jgi:hypothetical protein
MSANVVAISVIMNLNLSQITTAWKVREAEADALFVGASCKLFSWV